MDRAALGKEDCGLGPENTCTRVKFLLNDYKVREQVKLMFIFVKRISKPGLFQK